MIYCPRFIHTLYCDDIRREYNGKLTLVGAYQGTLNLQGVAPVILPKICVMVSAQTPRDQPFAKLKFKLLKNQEVMQEVELPGEVLEHGQTNVAEGSNFHLIGLMMELQQFQIDDDCVLRVVAETESEVLGASGIQVHLAPVPETSSDEVQVIRIKSTFNSAPNA